SSQRGGVSLAWPKAGDRYSSIAGSNPVRHPLYNIDLFTPAICTLMPPVPPLWASKHREAPLTGGLSVLGREPDGLSSLCAWQQASRPLDDDDLGLGGRRGTRTLDLLDVNQAL